MKEPNFFIIGAPKCGTTSLAAWLSGHPNIYMSSIKEPTYFSSDLGNQRIRDIKSYQKLFERARPTHTRIGEASTSYLFSRVAVTEITAYAKNPKFIVGVRNPIELAQSLHNQKVYDGHEDELDFEIAWSLQEARSRGERVPTTCPDQKLLQYGQWSKLGSQIRRLIAKVPRKNVFIYQLGDMKNDPRELYVSVLKFLDLTDDGRLEFQKLNERKIRKHAWAFNAARKADQFIRRLGIRNFRLGIFEKLEKVSQQPLPKKQLGEEITNRMRDYFEEDMRILHELTGVSLSNWKY